MESKTVSIRRLKIEEINQNIKMLEKIVYDFDQKKEELKKECKHRYDDNKHAVIIEKISDYYNGNRDYFKCCICENLYDNLYDMDLKLNAKEKKDLRLDR